MAPEYVTRGLFSIKSDVFSFGILVLEIVTGRKNSGSDDEDSENSEVLLSYAWEKWRNGTTIDLIDPATVDHCPINEVLRFIHIGLLCVQENPADRPNMPTVNDMLSSSTVTLPIPSRPPFVYGMSTIVSEGSNSDESKHDGSQTRPLKERATNEISISDLEAR